MTGCALLERIDGEGRLSREEPHRHLVRAQVLLAQGDYEGSLQESQAALSLSGGRPPGDEALFTMGLIYIHPGNPAKDYTKSVDALMRLMIDYPKSGRVEEARILVQAIQEIESVKRASVSAAQENEKLKRASVSAAQENEKLKRALAEAVHENERLKRVIEQSTKVDIEIEEKKKEKAR